MIGVPSRTLVLAAAILSTILWGIGGGGIRAGEEPGKPQPSDMFYGALEEVQNGERRAALEKFLDLLRRAPRAHPTTYGRAIDLASSLGECELARLLYRGYRNLEDIPERDLGSFEEKCRNGVSSAGVQFEFVSDVNYLVRVDGFAIAEGSGKNLKLRLPPGERRVEIAFDGYRNRVLELRLERGEQRVRRLDLEEKTRYGRVSVQLENSQRADLRVEPRELDRPRALLEPVTRQLPLEEPIRLPAGTYLLVVEREGYRRWMRRVRVEPEGERAIQVGLRGKPGTN